MKNKLLQKVLIIVSVIILLAGLVLVSKLYINNMCLTDCNITLENDPFSKSYKSEISESTEISGSLYGYYYTYVNSGEYVDVPFSETCEAFIVTKGNDENGRLINNYFIDLIKKGNTVGKMSESNELILNLDTEDIDNLAQIKNESLRNSSIDNQVEIQVKKIVQKPKEATPCHSFIELNDVTTN